MNHSSRIATRARVRRRPVVGITVHAARRPRRARPSRIRFIHAAGASLALAALGYLATAKAADCSVHAGACAQAAAIPLPGADRN